MKPAFHQVLGEMIAQAKAKKGGGAATPEELAKSVKATLGGSAFEVTPVVSVDRYSVGDGRVGPLTKAIQATYLDVARGQVGLHREWLTPVYGAKQ